MDACWAALLLLLCSHAAAESRYLFTSPKVLTSETTESMCLLLLEPPGPAQLSLELLDQDRSVSFFRKSVAAEPGKLYHKCFDVEVPRSEGSVHDMHLLIHFNGNTSYSVNDTRKVVIRGLGDVLPLETVYIQTDKAVYKPGQKVFIRLLSVDERLRPRLDPLPVVSVTSPAGTRLAQWRDVEGPAGLVQLEFQLDEDPVLGDWVINVAGKKTDFSKTFEVDEFVLPKFEVTVQGPAVLYEMQESVTWKVCGKYTHGQPVHGVANISISSGRQHSWLRNSHEEFTDSKHTDETCAVFKMSPAVLGLGGCGYHSIFNVEVHASLTEDGTGVTLKSDKTNVPTSRNKFQIKEAPHRQKYIKPGLLFSDEVRLTSVDGGAAAGVKVNLCYSSYDEREQKRKSYLRFEDSQPLETLCKNFTSDSAGVVSFGILLQNENVTKVEIKAEVPSSELDPPVLPGPTSSAVRHRFPERKPCNFKPAASLHLSRSVWYSNSRAFVQLDTSVDTAQISCGSNVDIPVRLTAPAPGPVTLYYQIMAEGRTVASDSVSVPLDKGSDVSSIPLSGAAFGQDQNSKWQQHPLGEVTIPVTLDQRMSSGFAVLVFTLVDGEVVADSHQYDATPCLRNRVSLAWRPDQAAPKDTVRLKLAASPGSVCGLDVVDKSVNLLSTSNRISLNSYFAELKKLNQPDPRVRAIDDRKYCETKYGKAEDWIREKKGIEAPGDDSLYDYHYGYSLLYWKTTFLDSLTAFDNQPLVASTDLELVTRPCYTSKPRLMLHFSPRLNFGRPFRMGLRRRGGAPARAPQAANIAPLSISSGVPGPVPMTVNSPPMVALESGASPPPADKPRTYFPETWLFDLHTVGSDGELTLSQPAPDTITEWVAGAVCSSEEDGIGLASHVSLTTFQPFFVTYTLPYSVKRGETLVLKVSVLNYSGQQLPVRLTLSESDEFETLSEPVVISCVDASTPEVLPFRLRPRQLGQVNISVQAEVFPDYPATCGPETVLAFSDAVIRPVLVEPEGFEREEVHSKFMCITPDQQELTGSVEELQLSWPLQLPENVVPDSERAHVSVVGELLGPSLDNLDRLVRQPTGCGEQNMVLFSPNIHVMKYLSAVGELTEELKQKLTNNMKTGYRRELNYRHDDKSFSAFGNSDPSGSMWLTAFVVKSFGDAADFIDVDNEDLKESVRWIEKQQTKSGCFPSVGRVLHKEMKGGVTTGGQQSLTAYVTSALLSSGVRVRNSTVSDALRCLSEEGATDDVYTLTVRTYALALAGRLSQARQDMAQLISRAVRESGLLHWTASGREDNRALSVEMGAYNVLTMAILDKESGGNDFFLDSLATVRWIAEQRNSQGGFVSTQDTVLALEALATFSLRLPRVKDTDMKVQVSDGHDADRTLHVTSSNRLLTQRLAVHHLPAEVDVSASGTGCALVQAILKYNIKDPEPKEAFEMTITASGKSGQKECLKHNIDICVGYTGDDEESNMAVVELEMISGFVPSKTSLRELKASLELDLKRWDVNNNKVAFYFESLPAGVPPRCFTLRVHREQEVEDLKPAVATVFDYYRTEQQISLTYRLDVDCEQTLHFPESSEPSSWLPEMPIRAPLLPIEGRRRAFDGWWESEQPLALPQGPEGPFPVLLPPPEGFQRPHGLEADPPGQQDEEGPGCPECLDPIRTADFRHYLCLEGDVYMARLSELGKLSYEARWKAKGSRRTESGSQQLVIEDGCECHLDTGRPLYLFGVTGDERRQQRLQLTDQHVLAPAPAAKRLQRRQLQLAIAGGC